MFKRLFISILWICIGLTACGGKVELLRDISEVEANEVLAALLDAGIHAEKLAGKEGMVSLSVEQGQFSRAIALLTSEGLPHEKYAKMGDVFRKEGMISSPLEERARYLWALSQELSATVSQIDGVIKARVHVVLPERSNGSDPSMPSSAAVFIKHKSGFNYDDVIPQVKRLVSNSIPGLVQEKVTVVMLPSLSRADFDEKSSKPLTVPERPSSAQLPKSSSDRSPSLDGAAAIWGSCIGLLIILFGAAFFIWKKWGGQPLALPAMNTSTPSQGAATKESDKNVVAHPHAAEGED